VVLLIRQFKVRRIVVQSIAIDVVDYFRFKQRPAKLSLHDDAVLAAIAGLRVDESVAFMDVRSCGSHGGGFLGGRLTQFDLWRSGL